nr:hypothetical protein [Tanacetum cinerariifolium]
MEFRMNPSHQNYPIMMMSMNQSLCIVMSDDVPFVIAEMEPTIVSPALGRQKTVAIVERRTDTFMASYRLGNGTEFINVKHQMKETICQAYYDGQTQNQQLLQQSTDRDNYNSKVMSFFIFGGVNDISCLPMAAEFAERDVTAARAAGQFSKAEKIAPGLQVAIDCVFLFFSENNANVLGWL